MNLDFCHFDKKGSLLSGRVARELGAGDESQRMNR